MFASAFRARAVEAFVDRWNLGKCAGSTCDRGRGIWQGLRYRKERVRLLKESFCFPDCFERELQRMLEITLAPPVYASTKSRRIPLGLLMLSRGSVTNPELQKALHMQIEAGGGLIGEWLQKLGFANEYDVTAALAKQWSCPLVRTMPRAMPARMPSPQGAECALPIHLLRAFKMAPVHFSKLRRILHLAFAGEIDYPALVSIEQMLDCKTEPCLTTRKELESALDRFDGRNNADEKVFESYRAPEDIVRIVSNYTARLDAIEVRCVRCGNFIWTRILGSASDVTNLLFRQSSTTSLISKAELRTAAS